MSEQKSHKSDGLFILIMSIAIIVLVFMPLPIFDQVECIDDDCTRIKWSIYTKFMEYYEQYGLCPYVCK